jgi:O-antigen/teichoic acid export membrane protein
VRQQLVKNLLFVLIVNILVKAVWIFFIDRNVQILVGYESYGAFQALFNLGMIFQILLDFGLTQYTSKEIASHQERIGEIFSSMLWARIILSLVYVITVLTIAFLLGYNLSQISLLLGVLGILSLNSLLVFLRSNVAALHYFKTDGLLAIIDRLLMIIVCGLLLFLPHFSKDFKIEWFVWSQIGCYALAVIIAFFVLFRISPVHIQILFKPEMIKEVLIKSAPFAMLVFLMSIYMRADAVLIERLCGENGKMQAGIYASAFRLLDVANIFGVMFAGMLMPIFSKMFAKQEMVSPMIRISVNIMMPISFIVAVISLTYGNEIMESLYHKQCNHLDGMIFSILMWTFPAYCLMYIYSTLLTAKGEIRLLNLISFFIVGINLILHTILITIYQAVGAAWVVFFTEWLVASVVIFYAHRQCKLPHNYPWLMSHIGFILCLAFLSFVIHLWVTNWILGITIVGFCSLILLFLFKFWTWSNFKEIISRKN